MRLALLGIDGEVLRLAAAAQAAGHGIVWLGDVGAEFAAAAASLAAGVADRAAEWELLLGQGAADAVVVGRVGAEGDLRAEQLRRLAAEAVPLLVVHPIFGSVLPYYELDMTRRETGGIVRHYNPLAQHPVVGQLAEWMRSQSVIGPVHQLTCERRLADTSAGSALAHLARDVELLAAVAGDIRRVTAIGPGPDHRSFAALQVQMTTSGAASLRWSVRPAGRAAEGIELTLLGEDGTVTLRATDHADAEGQPEWRLETSVDQAAQSLPIEPYDPAAAAIAQLADAVAETDAERRAAASSWGAATRAMEVVDAVELSLEKGRTIDVVQQQFSERLAFRGTMAAVGCGLLLVGFAAMVLITLLGGAEGAVGRRIVPAWPLVLLGLLTVFLLLQAVPFFAAKKRRPGRPEPPAGDGSGVR